MATERLFGTATTRDGVRHACYEKTGKFGHALCDHRLNLAWCEPLQPSQKTCNRLPCKSYAKEARASHAE
jgi:hypothetical protein